MVRLLSSDLVDGVAALFVGLGRLLVAGIGRAFQRSAKCMVLGDVGVVASVVNRRGTVAGQDTSGQFATVDTWLRREGRWKIINRVVLPLRA